MSDQMEEFQIKQTRGPTLNFTGKLLAETEWETSGRGTPLAMGMEIYETAGGALVAVTWGKPIDGRGFEDTRAAVVEQVYLPNVRIRVPVSERHPTFNKAARDSGAVDVEAMRFAVMDHFDWDNRARSMVRKLGWSLTREIA